MKRAMSRMRCIEITGQRSSFIACPEYNDKKV